MSTSIYDNIHALTGIPGSGKSTVAKFLEEFGATIVDADEIAHRAISFPDIVAEIRRTFGESVFVRDGKDIDRKKLGEIIFKDIEARKKLEAIIHPHIRALSDADLSAAVLAGKLPLIYDCPLFFELGLDKLGFKGVIVVSASYEQCLERTIARDGVTLEIAKSRIDSQIPIENKIAKGDFIIDNSGTLDDLRVKVNELFLLLI